MNIENLHQSQPPILIEIQGKIATITLNRPQAYNALSTGLMTAFEAALDKIEKDTQIACVLLKAAGKGFCAGHDLKELIASENQTKRRAIFEQCSRLMLKIQSMPMPVIAGVQGIATAAGCQLVASCDLAIASIDARFATPGVNIGLFCSTPMVALSRAIGRKRAMKMLLDGEFITSTEAENYGLINQVVPVSELDSALLTLAQKITSKSKATLKIGKQAFYRQIDMDISLAYDYCSEVMAINMGYQDAKEGIDAFITKRHPVWKNS